MSIQFRSEDLSPVEISFLKWQYGFEEEDDPFERSLWHTILHAWEADRRAFLGDSPNRTDQDAFLRKVSISRTTSRAARLDTPKAM